MARVEYSQEEVELMAYALYVRDWMVNNADEEGMPVCFNEFVDNEYIDCAEYISELFIDANLGDWIESYNLYL